MSFTINYLAIKNNLEKKHCPTHLKKPTIKIKSGEKLSITACCEKFHESLKKEIDKEVSEQADSWFKSLL